MGNPSLSPLPMVENRMLMIEATKDGPVSESSMDPTQTGPNMKIA